MYNTLLLHSTFCCLLSSPTLNSRPLFQWCFSLSHLLVLYFILNLWGVMRVVHMDMSVNPFIQHEELISASMADNNDILSSSRAEDLWPLVWSETRYPNICCGSFSPLSPFYLVSWYYSVQYIKSSTKLLLPFLTQPPTWKLLALWKLVDWEEASSSTL